MKTLFLILGATLALAACSPDSSTTPPAKDAAASSNMGPGGSKNPSSCSVHGDTTTGDDTRNSISPEADAHNAEDTVACEHP